LRVAIGVWEGLNSCLKQWGKGRQSTASLSNRLKHQRVYSHAVAEELLKKLENVKKQHRNSLELVLTF
jgi:hypothetical protein